MSFRRSELIVYLLAQRENLESFFPKPQIMVGDSLKVYVRGREPQIFDFNKAFMNGKANSEN